MKLKLIVLIFSVLTLFHMQYKNVFNKAGFSCGFTNTCRQNTNHMFLLVIAIFSSLLTKEINTKHATENQTVDVLFLDKPFLYSSLAAQDRNIFGHFSFHSLTTPQEVFITYDTWISRKKLLV